MKYVVALGLVILATFFFAACGSGNNAELEQRVVELESRLNDTGYPNSTFVNTLEESFIGVDVLTSLLEEDLEEVRARVRANHRFDLDPGTFGEGSDDWGVILTKKVLIKRALEAGDLETARILAMDLFAGLNLFCTYHVVPNYIAPKEVRELVGDYFAFEKDDTGSRVPDGVLVKFAFPQGC